VRRFLFLSAMKKCPYDTFQKKVAEYHAAGRVFEEQYKKLIGGLHDFGRRLLFPLHGGQSRRVEAYICYGGGYPRHVVDVVVLPESLFLLGKEVSEMAEKLFENQPQTSAAL